MSITVVIDHHVQDSAAQSLPLKVSFLGISKKLNSDFRRVNINFSVTFVIRRVFLHNFVNHVSLKEVVNKKM